MKMNPPASSSSPTSRKKPRIMRHPLSVAPPKRPSANTGTIGEIQPHQYLMSPARPYGPALSASESVDAAKPGLYKGFVGGGRNPAAPVLLAAPTFAFKIASDFANAAALLRDVSE